ncbi:hypothetical protein [Moorena sp. SIO3I6]|uniref:hypothetical protein n=1 Tax=Moorena sp. SIO3I6 TaxID=2607831 RepID=UPI0013FBEFB8|nr:hypothetical protein [Moorena sp. SIO3I6]NEP28899.1 hypothetical protein [Moorena sp. SIO3I6]
MIPPSPPRGRGEPYSKSPFFKGDLGGSPSFKTLPTPYSLLPTPYSLLPVPCSLFPVPYSLPITNK